MTTGVAFTTAEVALTITGYVDDDRLRCRWQGVALTMTGVTLTTTGCVYDGRAVVKIVLILIKK